MYLIGDINNPSDGKVTGADVVYIASNLSGLSNEFPLGNNNYYVNHTYTISNENINFVTLLSYYIAKIPKYVTFFNSFDFLKLIPESEHEMESEPEPEPEPEAEPEPLLYWTQAGISWLQNSDNYEYLNYPHLPGTTESDPLLGIGDIYISEHENKLNTFLNTGELSVKQYLINNNYISLS